MLETYDEDTPFFLPRDMERVERRVRLTPWGRRVAQAVEESDHPYSTIAKCGKGWVELYVCQGNDLELPPRPDYYKNSHETEDDSEGIEEDFEETEEDSEDESMEESGDDILVYGSEIDDDDDDDDDDDESM